MKILERLFGKASKSRGSAQMTQEGVNVREVEKLIGQLASLTQNQVADFVVFGKPPPSPVRKLIKLGPQVVPWVTQELESELAGSQATGGSVMSVISLAFILCTIGTRECLPGILRVMDYSTFALFLVHTGQGVSMVDPFEWLYDLCAETIGRVGEKSIVPQLLRILRDPRKDQVRPSACKAVGLLRAPEARQALTAALEDHNMDTGGRVRKEAAQALKLLDESA